MNSNAQRSLRIIGVMSGTSLDGLDLALCQFELKGEQGSSINHSNFTYSIINAETIPYDEQMRSQLIKSMKMSGLELSKFDRDYGRFIGESIILFSKKFNIDLKTVDYISSHGHTVFHNPDEKYTVQIGHGSSIAGACKVPTISDFRSLDVALGGQGAPLVPIGDQLLFSEYKYCLNVGGILNISYDEIQQEQNTTIRKAFDVSPGNIILNYLCKKYFNVEYDVDGERASKGKVSTSLLKSLEAQEFFHRKGPKSLGKEHVEKDFLSLIEEQHTLTPEDKLCTTIEMMAKKTAESLQNKIEIRENTQVLVTGGGAYNKYFISRLNNFVNQSKIKVVIPNNLIVEFKEALLFAFLGFLRVQGIPNCLKSVTGASQDNIGGCIYII